MVLANRSNGVVWLCSQLLVKPNISAIGRYSVSNGRDVDRKMMGLLHSEAKRSHIPVPMTWHAGRAGIDAKVLRGHPAGNLEGSF
jgi:hypothetical protein